VITPRITRLVRVPDPAAFRDALAALACEGNSFDARSRLVVVPTRAASAHLVRTIENRLPQERPASALPELITPGELTERLAARLGPGRPLLSGAEREALLGVACRVAKDAGTQPPFRLRAGLIAEILRFYDALRRNQKDVATFERLALGMLEPGAAIDRGAERLVRQTRFLVEAFRRFEQLCEESGGIDEHGLRARVLAEPASRPWRHAVVAVGDRSRDPHGLTPTDWDLLARVPGLERIDVVVTNTALAGAFHERVHQLLPGIEETHAGGQAATGPVLLVPPGDVLAHVARDREEEVAGFARWVKQAARQNQIAQLDRVALVVRQPLPYVYVAREVLRSAGIPCQLFDALPLAGEPYAAALDLVFSFVSSSFARVPGIALLRSPHFRFAPTVRDPFARDEPRRHGDTEQRLPEEPRASVSSWPMSARDPVTAKEIAALDRALSEAGYLGEHDALARIVARWREAGATRGLIARALPAGEAFEPLARQLLPLCEDAPVADHLDTLLMFLRTHENLPGPDDPLRARQLRARSAILATLGSLRDAYRRFDPAPVAFDDVAAMVRRWIEGQTFAPRTGESGVHIVDAESVRFGDFDHVQLAGLVDGEWPERPRRNIFYSPALLRDLGWTAETDRIDGVRAAFADLLKLPSARLRISAFTLEDDAVVAPSTLMDEVAAAGLDASEWTPDGTQIFEYEARGLNPLLPAAAIDPRFQGMTGGHAAAAFSLSALERYQECPFKFFASEVLRLEEAPEDEETLSPRARGRFIHELFQRFFEAWDARGAGTITSDRLDEARSLFEEVASPLLDALPEAEASLERARLFGSAIAVGIVDVVLGLEAARPIEVRERWLERRFEGEFALRAADGRRVPLRGVADRIDLLEGNRLRVFDYKSGYPPEVKRALQVPIYALCAQETLEGRDGQAWTVDEAAYLAFSGKRALVPVIKDGTADPTAVLAAARDRLFEVIEGVAGGIFPPRPHEPRTCTYCAYASVCRKDYVGDE
jgi:RecB family exonuclease